MKQTIEIVDENGNIHGPFASQDEIDRYVESRALGEQRDPNAESESGWYFRLARS